MAHLSPIPNFTLFGETAHFPDVVHCERISTRASAHAWKISAHRHAQMVQLLHIEDGHVAGLVDGVAFELENDGILYIPAQAAHAFTFRPGTRGRVLSFPLAVLHSAGPATDELVEVLSHPVMDRATGAVIALVGQLASALQQSGSFRAAKVLGLSHALLAELAETARSKAPSRTTASDNRMARLDRLIAEHMGEDWSASDYADALSVTTGHLSRLCRAAKGCGAAAYIEQVVIEEACRLLAFTQVPVSEVGYRLGFNDPSYFSKRFRGVRGLAPSAYRRRFVSRDAVGPGEHARVSRPAKS